MSAHFNRFELENYAQSAAGLFVNEGVDLNDTITKQAEENGFTPHHVDRVVQNANIFVNAALVKEARDKGQDPRVSFPLAKSDEIQRRLNGPAAHEERLQKEAQVIDLFTVRKQAVDRSTLLDNTVGKTAPDPYAKLARSVDHVKLASSFVNAPDDAVEDAKTVDASSLSYACQALENLQHRALTDSNLAKNAMDIAATDLQSEIQNQILCGAAPATVRDVVKQAGLDENTAVFVDKLITKVAAGIQAREGKSAFVHGSLVNKQHPLIIKSAAVRKAVDVAIGKRKGLDKLSSAHKSAREQYVRAVREGR